MYANIPLLWVSENDSIYPSDVLFPEGQNWYDSIMYDQHHIRIFGFSDLNDSMDTHGIRQQMMSIQFQVMSQQSQVITIDSTWDDRNYSLKFGLPDGVTEFTPALVAGGIIYDPLGTDNNSGQTPGVFSLSQNYPNPFNAQTTIRYSLPETGPVTLTIYNLLGQKVATLFDGVQTAGEHKVVWDANKMSSGEYIMRLAHKDESQAKVLLIQK